MSGFMYPGVLGLLLLLPVGVAFFIWRERIRAVRLRRIAGNEIISGLTGPIHPARRIIKLGLWFLVLSALILAAARPVWGLEADVIETQGVSVMVVLDVSASMNAQDVPPSRLERAKFVLRDLFAALTGHELGLVLFAGQPVMQFPLTTDTGAAVTFLNAANTESITHQGTALEAALRLALSGFDAGRSGSQIIVLVSDGENFDGDPLTAADEAVQRNVTIYALGVGNPDDGAPIPVYDVNGQVAGYKSEPDGSLVLSRLDETTLKAVAERTGGIYWRLDSDTSAALVDRIDTAQAGLLSSRTERRGVERFGVFVALALLALSMEMLLPETSLVNNG